MREVLFSGYVEPAELVNLINRWFRRATVLLIVKCSVEYSGRASSTSREAVRLVVLKQDGTILVHESAGRDPLNWQPRATVSAKLLSEREVEVRAIRRSPDEELVVKVSGGAFATVVLLGSAGLDLYGREEDLIEEIAKNPSSIIRGAALVAREISTPYGRVDLVLKDSSGKLLIVEVKRSRASVEAAQQLHRYVEYYRRLGIEVDGVLIAPDASSQALKYLSDHGMRYLKYSVKPPQSEKTSGNP